ncbi:DUF2461 domain-containing protein [Chryseobacterium sp.]|uniref:DUF2461 domain-containing protein n=1 Tax=Chryseobacterium sp. TaxID=1871047 RepID=UPI0011CCCD2D|nr:DUF2461 domain-containing protein [Chryseobacterium sp.]TXF75017.1 DUF2461 domain-containing protein [Chryseobacterium sp.]
MKVIDPQVLEFLHNLKLNNNREWFNEHKTDFTEAQENVRLFVEDLIEEISKFDVEILKLDARKALYRIYRDTRFSKDKTPYKTNFGAGLGMGKGGRISGYYLHIEPGASFLAGGVYQPDSAVLKEIRKEISMNKEEFLKIINAKNFKKYFEELSQNEKLVKIPQGFEKDDPMAEFLKLKNFIVVYNLQNEDLSDIKSVEKSAEIFKAMVPLNKFLCAPF